MTAAPTGREFVDKAMRSFVLGTSVRICNLDQEYASQSVSFARRAARSYDKQRESVVNGRTVYAPRSSLDVRRATADKLREDVKRVMTISFDAAADSRNVSDSRKEMLTDLVEKCADVVHRDLTTEHRLNVFDRVCYSQSMSLLDSSLRIFFTEFEADLRVMGRNLIESTPATELGAEALRSIFDRFDTWQPLTRAKVRTQRGHQFLADVMQRLQTVTELKLTALHEQSDEGDKKEEQVLLKLRSALEGKVQKHISLAGTIPPETVWYGSEREPFQTDLEDDSEVGDDLSAHSEESS